MLLSSKLFQCCSPDWLRQLNYIKGYLFWNNIMARNSWLNMIYVELMMVFTYFKVWGCSDFQLWFYICEGLWAETIQTVTNKVFSFCIVAYELSVLRFCAESWYAQKNDRFEGDLRCCQYRNPKCAPTTTCRGSLVCSHVLVVLVWRSWNGEEAP